MNSVVGKSNQRFTNAQTHKRTNAQTHKRTNAQTHKRTNAQTHKRTNAKPHNRMPPRKSKPPRKRMPCVTAETTACAADLEVESTSLQRRLRGGGRMKPGSLPLGPGGRPMCRWCRAAEIPRGRRTFCGPACVHAHCMVTGGRGGDYARRAVHDRDRGVCALCGLDTRALAASARRVGREGGADALRAFLTAHGVPKNKRVRVVKFSGGLWEADHTVPVVEGGGAAALDNLRTLCFPCHRVQTAMLATRRAAQRRLEAAIAV
jgi:5-methylcytosine-specific restriction protein A